jgi:hypothetical protein
MSGFGDSARLNERKKGFKKGIDAEEARRKREDAAVQLRKQTREEALEKKRALSDGAGQPAVLLEQGVSHDSRIQMLAAQVCSPNPEQQFQSTQQIRKLLSIPKNAPIQELIDTGIVPRFVELLKDISRPELQFEVEWVLTNVAAGTPAQTKTVVEAGALPVFIQLLQSPNADVQEQAVWAIGNIAGDSTNLRDLVLHAGGLFPMMSVLQQTDKQSMIRNATWTLSNFCRGKPSPPFEAVKPALSILSLLIHSTDVEVLTDACWALSFISDGAHERITGVIQAGVVQRLVQLLTHPSALVQIPALRAVGNIVTGDDDQTQVVLQHDALPSLEKLLSHHVKSIRKEACWAISNITAGNKKHIDQVIRAGLISPVLTLLRQGDFDIKREASWVICNITTRGTPGQIEHLVTQGCLEAMVELLTSSDTKMQSMTLDALEKILQCGKNHQVEAGLIENPVVSLIEEADGLTKIEALQESCAEELYSKAVKILETYFPLEDGTENDMAPDLGFGANNVMPQEGFNFCFTGHSARIFG